MFDAMKLLGSMLEGQTNSASPSRLNAAAQSVGYASLGVPQPSPGGLGSFGAGGLGAVAGALLGKSGPGVLGGGLLGIVGNIAIQALQARMTAGGATAFAPTPVLVPVPVYTATTPDVQRKATLVVRAMIQAAKADGMIDATETQRIMGKINEHGHDPAANAFVQVEMAKPIDVAGLCREITSPQEAVEVYTASLIVMDLDSQAEQDYLADMASTLGISPEVTIRVHQALGLR